MRFKVLIAEVCYRVGYIDSWGRGIEKIANACKLAGLPAPFIEERTGGVAVELLKPQSAEKPGSKSASGKRRVSVGKTSSMILEACRENPSITIPEMAEQIGVTERSIQRNIQKLQADGSLRRLGGRKEGYWEVIENDKG